MCKTDVQQNHFPFRKTHYMQTEGLALELTTLAILSQVYLQQPEQKQIINLLTKPKMLGYFRDVEDIITVFNNTIKITELSKEFNRQENNSCLKFEMQ